MNDRQRAAKLDAAVRELTRTRSGYVQAPTGPHWRRAMAAIDAVLDDLRRPPVPTLGPVLAGGGSLLAMVPTHDTDGLYDRTGSRYPAADTAFGQIGRTVVAPEALTVTGQSSAQGGDAFYARGASGLRYWFGHLAAAPATGARFRKGARIGIVGSTARPHLHVGIDARALIGRDLRWGRDGNGPDYTFGSPTFGAQLTKALAA